MKFFRKLSLINLSTYNLTKVFATLSGFPLVSAVTHTSKYNLFFLSQPFEDVFCISTLWFLFFFWCVLCSPMFRHAIQFLPVSRIWRSIPLSFSAFTACTSMIAVWIVCPAKKSELIQYMAFMHLWLFMHCPRSVYLLKFVSYRRASLSILWVLHSRRSS